MAQGRLGKASLAATTNTPVCQMNDDGVININVCNRSDDAVQVRIAISETGTPGDADYIEYDAMVPPKGVLERTGIAVSAGEYVVARASATGISVRVHGYDGD